MNKNNFLMGLDKTAFVAIIVATIFVAMFQYLAISIFLYISMISYAIAFLTIIVLSVFRIYYAKTEVDNETYMMSKKQQLWLILKTILSFVLFVLSLMIALIW